MVTDHRRSKASTNSSSTTTTTSTDTTTNNNKRRVEPCPTSSSDNSSSSTNNNTTPQQQQSIPTVSATGRMSQENKLTGRKESPSVAASWAEFVKEPHTIPGPTWLDDHGRLTDPAQSEEWGEEAVLLGCVRTKQYSVAQRLIYHGVPVDEPNEKGVTPLTLAAQQGNLDLVLLLESRGANRWHVTKTGSTPVLVAAHHGHLPVLQYLLSTDRRHLEQANNNETTPLMRAAQQGHVHVVRLLCELGATVNRRNVHGMTSLMLAAQRGHPEVCRYLISKGANVNSKALGTGSTSLAMACRRGHVETVRVLVTAGADIFNHDSSGRSALDVVKDRYGHQGDSLIREKLSGLLDANIQVHLMRCQSRQERTWAWLRLWCLIQHDRVRLRSVEDLPLHEAIEVVPTRRPLSSSTMAWLRSLLLPAPLFQKIVQYCPLPSIWEKRVAMLSGRCNTNPNEALEAAFDVIDELLEELGYLEALDQVRVPPPIGFCNWTSWRSWYRRNTVSLQTNPSLSTKKMETPVGHVPDPQILIDHRRRVGYLQLLTQHAASLSNILVSPPYDIPAAIVQQLIVNSDICSLLRRMGTKMNSAVAFSPEVAMEIVILTSQLSLECSKCTT